MSKSNDHELNPVAVALKYQMDKDQAPVVVAAGNGYVAQRIIDLANKNNIPVYQDNSTASLLSSLQLGSEIPPELYNVLAEIYAFILRFPADGQKPQ